MRFCRIKAYNGIVRYLMPTFFVVFTFVLGYVLAEYQFDYTYGSTVASEYFDLSDSILKQQLFIDQNNMSSLSLNFHAEQGYKAGEIYVSLYKNDINIGEWSFSAQSLRTGDNIRNFEFKNLVASVATKDVLKLCVYGKNLQSVSIAMDNRGDILLVNDNKTTSKAIAYSVTIRKVTTKILFIIVFGMSCVALLICGIYQVNDKVIMSGVFLVALLCFLIVGRVGMEPDALAHFLRAYEIAEVNLLAQHVSDTVVGGDILPRALQEIDNSNACIDKSDVCAIGFENTALYSPINYLFQSMGIKIAGFFTDRVQLIYTGGRISNAIGCLLICLLALYIIPFGERVLFIVMLFPMTLQQMTTLSPDGIIIASSLFYFAYVLHLIYDCEEIKNKEIIILMITGVIISQLKIIYVVLLILVFAIPSAKVNTKIKEFQFKALCIFVPLIANLAWLKIASSYLIQYQPGVNVSAQVGYVLMNPWKFFSICVHSVAKNAEFWISSMVGSYLGSLDIEITPILWILMLLVLAYEVLMPTNKVRDISVKSKVIFLFSFLLGFALLLSSLYVQWTRYMSDEISGVQGRYFIPLLPLLLVCFLKSSSLNNNQLGVKNTSIISKIYLYEIIILCDGGGTDEYDASFYCWLNKKMMLQAEKQYCSCY